MIYAKCIKESQIVHNKIEFYNRQSEEYNVYCEGETTKGTQNKGDLYCVPLNYIYDCLKYGNYIGIVDIEDDEVYHLKSGSYLSYMKTSQEQKIIKILYAYSKEAIDFVFDEVKNPSLIKDGYIQWLPEDLREYFYNKMDGI